MRKDDHLIFEALVGMNSTQDYAQPTDAAGKPRPRTKEEIRARFNDAMARSMASRNGEDAENEPHGYPQGITAIQNVLINQLKKHGFTLTKISHADKERDAYPTVFMKKSQGAMHIGAEIDGMGYINGEPFKEYMMVRGYDAKNAGNKPYTPSGARPDPEDPAYDTCRALLRIMQVKMQKVHLLLFIMIPCQD